MNSGTEISLIKYYITHTLCDNFLIKFLSGIILGAVTQIYGANTPIINFIILIFVIDFFLWLTLAFKQRSFASGKFFKGAMKLGVYGILIYIWTGLDMILHTWDTLLGFMFAFIILRDAASIIEKLHLIGYNVPFFLIKYLDVAQQRLDSQISKMLEMSDAGIHLQDPQPETVPETAEEPVATPTEQADQ